MSVDITLRDLRDADKSLFALWLRKAHVARWYENPESWLDEIENRSGEFSWIHHFIAECGGEPIGFCQYYEYSLGGEAWHGDIDVDGAYSIDYLIGDDRYIGRGFGKKLILALTERISACTDAKLVIVKPDENNKASCGALMSAGFTFDESNKLYIMDMRRLNGKGTGMCK